MWVFREISENFFTCCWNESQKQSIKTTEREHVAWNAHQVQMKKHQGKTKNPKRPRFSFSISNGEATKLDYIKRTPHSFLTSNLLAIKLCHCIQNSTCPSQQNINRKQRASQPFTKLFYLSWCVNGLLLYSTKAVLKVRLTSTCTSPSPVNSSKYQSSSSSHD